MTPELTRLLLVAVLMLLTTAAGLLATRRDGHASGARCAGLGRHDRLRDLRLAQRGPLQEVSQQGEEIHEPRGGHRPVAEGFPGYVGHAVPFGRSL